MDYPRMVEGGLDGGFFVIYTAQGPLSAAGYGAARSHALLRARQIRDVVARHPAELELGLTAADAERIAGAGKRAVYLSLENSYPLGLDPAALATFYDLGVRLAGPVHAGDNQFAGSATGRSRVGLSPLGRRLVAEANRLGVILDGSHASDAAFDDLIALSTTPIIRSHSGLKWTLGHPRNLDDGRLRRLAAKGGVIQVNAVSEFLVPTPSIRERDAADREYETEVERYTAAEATAMAQRLHRLDRKYRVRRATFEDFWKTLIHAIEVAGIDHVGRGADWDGGGGVAGYEDTTDLPLVTARLRAAGYRPDEIGKIMSGNLLRVFRQVEAMKSGSGRGSGGR